MSLAEPVGPSTPAPPSPPSLPPFTRLSRIFAQPSGAWVGASEKGQWWFPLVLMIVIEVALSALTYQRALLPDMFSKWEQAVANGAMQQAQLESMQTMFSENPAMMAWTLGSIILILPLFTLLQALVLWFGAGFVLGAKFRFSQGLTVVSWSALVNLPASFVRYAYGWVRESFEGLHLGLGVLVPEPETHTKLYTGLTVFLDALSPFAAWYLAVLVLGTAALSGAPRRNVAWVLVTLYLAFVALSATVAAFSSSGL
ncbi:MAG: YIP1 family protein [Candidatus Eisenbacteria bacterium]